MKGSKSLNRIIAVLIAMMMTLPIVSSYCVFAEGEAAFDESNAYTITDTKNFVESTSEKTSGDDLVLKSGDTVKYTLPAPNESGMYLVSAAMTTTQEATKYYTLTGQIGDESYSGNTRCLVSTRVSVGSFYLEEGVESSLLLSLSVTAENKEMTLADVKITANFDKEISASEETIIPALKYTNRSFRTGTTDDEVPNWGSAATGALSDWNKGKATVVSGSYGIYGVNFEESGIYEVYTLTSGAVNQTISCSVDGEKVGSGSAKMSGGSYNKVVATKVCEYYFNEGSHTLRLDFGSTAYFQAFKVVPKTDFPEEVIYDVTSIYETDTASNLYYPKQIPTNPEYKDTFTDCYSFGGTHMTYNILLPKNGFYEVSLYIGSKLSTNTFAVSIDGEKISENFTATGNVDVQDYKYVVKNIVGIYEIEGGSHIIRIEKKSGSLYFYGIGIKTAGGDLKLNSISYDETEYEDGSEISKGTDYLDLDFNYNVNEETINENNITLTDSNGSVVPVIYETTGSKVTLIFKEALKADENYYLSVSGISPLYGSDAPSYEYMFTTSGEDAGKGTITCDSASCNYEDVSLSYAVKSSKGVGIKGRKVSLWRIAPNSIEEVFIGDFVSGDDGVLNLNDTIPENSPYGSYTYVAKCEYCEAAETKLVYVSKAREEELMDTLKETTEETISSYFEDNQIELGISIAEDLKNVPDKSKVYRHFAGADFAFVDDFNKAFDTAVLVETINAATEETKENVESIFENAEAQLLLKLDTNKLNVVLEKGKGSFINDVISLGEVETLENAPSAFNQVIDDNFASVCGKSPVKLNEKEIEVYTGQAIEIPLKFAEKATDVREIVLNISSNTLTFEKDNVKIENPEKTKASYLWNGDSLTVTIKYDYKTDVSDFGGITLNADDEEGEYSVNVEGYAVYDLNLDKNADFTLSEDIPVKAAILTSTFDVTVIKAPISDDNNAQTSRPTGSSRPSGGGSGSGSASKPVTNVPTITPVTKPDTPIVAPDEKFEFVDISNVDWAKESINTLLDLGVISESADKKFNPNDNIKRSEFIKLIVTALDLVDETAKASFTDVAENAWYYTYVASAQKAGIVYGDDSGAFNPDSYITRQDMSVMIERAMKLTGYKFDEAKGEEFLDDESISDYAKDAVYNLKNKGIINGTGDNLFTPLGMATRAQSAKMICEMIKVVG